MSGLAMVSGWALGMILGLCVVGCMKLMKMRSSK